MDNNKQIFVNESDVLLDKIVFTNVLVDDIKDIDKLIEKDVIQIHKGKEIKYLTKSGKTFDGLIIQDDKVNINAGISTQNKKAYCTMDVTIGDTETGNLCCKTVQEYKEHIQQIKKYLQEQYGITICTDCMYPKSIEINKTFKLAGDYDEYQRVFKTIMYHLPPKSYLNRQIDFSMKDENGYKTKTFYAKSCRNNKSKQYLEFKIYDKTESIMGFITLADQYVRFEFKMVGRVKKKLKINTFNELTDEVITSWFNARIEDYIVAPLKKMQKERQKDWLSIMEQERNKGGHWISNILGLVVNQEVKQGYPIFLDVEELVAVVRKMKLDAKKRGKIVASLRRQSQRIYTVLSNHDDDKLAEIIEKLTHHVTHHEDAKGLLVGMQKVA